MSDVPWDDTGLATPLTGEDVYVAYRAAWADLAKRDVKTEPAWRRLKPWKQKVWNRVAEALNAKQAP